MGQPKTWAEVRALMPRKRRKLAPDKSFGRKRTLADNVHPIVKVIFDEMEASRISTRRIGEITGYHSATIRRWYQGQPAMLFGVSDVLDALGYDLVAVKRAPKE